MTSTNPTTKRTQLTKLITRKSGASIQAIQTKFNWQRHTVRAEVSRLRKQGLVVTCAPSPKGPVYLAHVPERTR